jgi:hypothetical protein
MRCRQRLEADRARPAIDPGLAGRLAKATEDSVRVGQHPAIMPLPGLTRGKIGRNACTDVQRLCPRHPPWRLALPSGRGNHSCRGPSRAVRLVHIYA